MDDKKFNEWYKERLNVPLNDDAAAAISLAIDKPQYKDTLQEALEDLECTAKNPYNRDSFRVLFTAIHDFVDAYDRLDREYTQLNVRYEKLEREVPRKCEKCGMPIIDGLNGCQDAGNICFSCKPFHPCTAPAHRPAPNEEEIDFMEGRCLDMGGPMPD